MEQNFKIAVPEGCTANIEKKDGFLIVTFEPEKWEPKDGDVIVLEENENYFYSIIIYAGESKEGWIKAYVGFFDIGSRIEIDTSSEGFWGKIENYRPATEEEKQRLFDALAKKGKRWNVEEKRIEDLPRWRACNGTYYYYINQIGSVRADTEAQVECDDIRYESCNYFKTYEAAEKVAKQIREIFKNSKAE